MSIVVYTKPACVQCDSTIRALDAAGIVYTTVDLTTDHDARDYVMNTLGYSSAPIIEVDGDDHWSGFRPDRIKALASAHPRSPERTQFLVDVLSTAVETGISYWAETVHVEDHTGTTPEGDNLDPLGSGGGVERSTENHSRRRPGAHTALAHRRGGRRVHRLPPRTATRVGDEQAAHCASR